MRYSLVVLSLLALGGIHGQALREASGTSDLVDVSIYGNTLSAPLDRRGGSGGRSGSSGPRGSGRRVTGKRPSSKAKGPGSKVNRPPTEEEKKFAKEAEEVANSFGLGELKDTSDVIKIQDICKFAKRDPSATFRKRAEPSAGLEEWQWTWCEFLRTPFLFSAGSLTIF